MTLDASFQQGFLRTQTQIALTRAICGKLIAMHRDDQETVTKAEHYIAGFRNILVEMDAVGSQRKFARGQVVTLKAPTGNDGIIAGYASTSDLDAYSHRVAGGAFSEAIRKRGLTGPGAIKLLLDHDHTKPAGLIRVLEYRGDKLFIEAQMNLDIEYVRDRYSAAKMLNGFNFSVGFIMQDYEIKTDTVTKDQFIQVNKGDLFEVSVVAFPANEAAVLDEIKAAPGGEVTPEMILDKFAEMKRVLR